MGYWQWGEGFTPILAFPREGGRKGSGRGEGGMGFRVREETGGERENGGEEGVFMGGMVARGVEGMGFRMRVCEGGMGFRVREETGGERGNGGGMGFRVREGVAREGGWVSAFARKREGGMGCVCAGETGGGTPILAFPRKGGRDGLPHSCSGGERENGGEEGVFMGGMVAGERDFGQGKVGSGGRSSPPS